MLKVFISLGIVLVISFIMYIYSNYDKKRKEKASKEAFEKFNCTYQEFLSKSKKKN